MNKLLKFSFIVGLIACTFIVQAESTKTQGYELISPAQPTLIPEKVEVLEFFSFGCPHCYSFEPTLKTWLDKHAENINFIRMPVLFGKKSWEQYARAFFTAESLGIEKQINDDFFDAVHNKKQKLITESQLAEFFGAHGIDEATFLKHYNSFIVNSKMGKAKTMSKRYDIRSVPTIVINGKYKTNDTGVMDQLVAKESKKTVSSNPDDS